MLLVRRHELARKDACLNTSRTGANVSKVCRVLDLASVLVRSPAILDCSTTYLRVGSKAGAFQFANVLSSEKASNSFEKESRWLRVQGIIPRFTIVFSE